MIIIRSGVLNLTKRKCLYIFFLLYQHYFRSQVAPFKQNHVSNSAQIYPMKDVVHRNTKIHRNLQNSTNILQISSEFGEDWVLPLRFSVQMARGLVVSTGHGV